MLPQADLANTELRIPLEEASWERVGGLVQSWAQRSCLEGKTLDRLLVAVGEVVEAAYTLGRALHVPGDLKVRVLPFSRWITVELTFPRGIPLVPHFEQAAEILQEYPGMRLHPDIFWRRVILQWIDKATWLPRGSSVTISLSQYARQEGRAGDLYFLGLTPKPVPGLNLQLIGDQVALATTPLGQSAFRLTPEGAFILRAVDGQNSVRDIYRSYVRKFGLVHPASLGTIIEDLIGKGLIVPGEALVSDSRRSAPWWQFLGRLLRLQYSVPGADRIFEALNRRLGWLWSKTAGILALIIIAGSLWLLDWSAPSGGFIFGRLPNFSDLSIGFIVFYLLGLYLSIFLHELSHGVVCTRNGGKVHALGLMFFYGMLCAYVDTTEAWMFQNRWRRVMVSLAGPLSTLLLACLFGWGRWILDSLGHQEAASLFATLSITLSLSFVLNMIPFLELDGYYILVDILDWPNLQQKSFAYLGKTLSYLAGGKGLPALPPGERLLYLAYSLSSIVVLSWLILWPLIQSLIDLLAGKGNPLGWLLIMVAFLILVEKALQGGLGWYRRSALRTLDLKA